MLGVLPFVASEDIEPESLDWARKRLFRPEYVAKIVPNLEIFGPLRGDAFDTFPFGLGLKLLLFSFKVAFKSYIDVGRSVESGMKSEKIFESISDVFRSA